MGEFSSAGSPTTRRQAVPAHRRTEGARAHIKSVSDTLILITVDLLHGMVCYCMAYCMVLYNVCYFLTLMYHWFNWLPLPRGYSNPYLQWRTAWWWCSRSRRPTWSTTSTPSTLPWIRHTGMWVSIVLHLDYGISLWLHLKRCEPKTGS